MSSCPVDRPRLLLMVSLLTFLSAGTGLVAQDRSQAKITCKSENYGRNECRAGGTIELVRVAKHRSDAPCAPGKSYGFDGDILWVDKGCAGDFEVTFLKRESDGPGWWEDVGSSAVDREMLDCESKNFGRRECYVDGQVTDVKIRERKSRAPCEPGESFGFQADYLWVDRGCSGKFEITFKRNAGRNDSDRPWWERLGSSDSQWARVRCSSRDYGRNVCSVPGIVKTVRVADRKSRADCLAGESFGFHEDFIWVDRGCDADFEVEYRPVGGGGSSGGSGWGRSDTVEASLVCGSNDYRRNLCYIDGMILQGRLKKQRSNAPCIEGDTYGFYEDVIWVDKGCEGEFEFTYRQKADQGWGWETQQPEQPVEPSGPQTERLTCKSDNYRLKKCSVDGLVKSVIFRKKKSRAPCEEGKTWGFGRDHIWVTDGCAAEFEVTFDPR